MVTVRSEVTARDEFIAVVLADPELLDLAFAEVIASWESEPPGPPKRTLVATSERRGRPRRTGWTDRECQCRQAWLRAIPRPGVARSPPMRSVAGHFWGRDHPLSPSGSSSPGAKRSEGDRSA
jgi:hypothetical protein